MLVLKRFTFHFNSGTKFLSSQITRNFGGSLQVQAEAGLLVTAYQF